jgi:hypothetical protein
VNPSLGSGSGLVTFDLDLFTMRVQASFQDLEGTTSAAHIHCCTLPTAGVATEQPSFTGFPLGVTAGTYDHTFDMMLAASYGAGFLSARGGDIGQAFEDLLNASRAGGTAYLNIHTSFRSGGEIRGFLTPVPEPGTCMLALFGVAGAFMKRRAR